MAFWFGSRSTAQDRLIIYFLIHPDSDAHFQALRRRLGVGARPLRAALETLGGRGLLRVEVDRNRTIYRVNAGHPGWNALWQMVRAFGDPTDVVREALVGVQGIDAAFVFGSVASGEQGEHSDVDVMVIGDDISRRDLGRGTLESSALLGREVNVTRYTTDGIRRRVHGGDPFIGDVLNGPMRWLVGSARWRDEIGA